MSRTYYRVFNDKEKLDELIALRKLGWNLSQLARYFEVDHTSIRHHVIKLELVGAAFSGRKGEIRELPEQVRIAPPLPDEDNWYYNELGERVSKGKPYKQIHEEAEQRRAKQPVQRIVILTNWRSQNGYF